MPLPLLNTKAPGEVVTITFDYCALLGVGEAISSAAPSIAVRAGDQGQSLDGMLQGQPEIVGHRVKQRLAGGLLGNVYRVKCRIETDSGQVFEVASDVPVNTVFGV